MKPRYKKRGEKPGEREEVVDETIQRSTNTNWRGRTGGALGNGTGGGEAVKRSGATLEAGAGPKRLNKQGACGERGERQRIGCLPTGTS